ncbi:MAG: hypothetical protein RBR74_11345 [Ignavibacteriaceae bacterium]|jgi:hypothetical protein|nr:hypothetical protein [Ignavibacteriaceae bacterium]
MYDYISEKARLFLLMNPEIYRKDDALGMPDPELTDEEMDLLSTGCRQIIEGKGKTAGDPLTGIGIHGFYLLIELFHFELSRQSAIETGEDGFLDKMECSHVVSGDELVLYNHVTN